MQINPSEISELIKSKIENLKVAAEKRTEGTVISVTDGICRIHGLTDVMQGEMLEFPGGTQGLALNLERDSVGAVVLGAYEHISEGDTVKSTSRILEVLTREHGRLTLRSLRRVDPVLQHGATDFAEVRRYGWNHGVDTDHLHSSLALHSGNHNLGRDFVRMRAGLARVPR